MYQLAIFDLDGTLLDTLADLHAGVNHALAAFGYAPRTLDQARTSVGTGAQTLLARAAPAGRHAAATRDGRARPARHEQRGDQVPGDPHDASLAT